MGVPVVLYESVVDDTTTALRATTGGVTVAAGSDARNIFSPFTYPADSLIIQRGTSTGTISIQFNATADFSAIGFVIQGIKDDAGAEVRVLRRLTNTLTSTIAIIDVDRDGVFLATFDSQEFDYPDLDYYIVQLIGIDEESSDSENIVWSVATIGNLMSFEKCIMRSYAPLDYNRSTEFLTNESGTGQYMGRSIVRRNYQSSVSFDLMSAPWVRSTFQPFVRHARTKPYFFAWNKDTYPNEVNYVWTDDDIGATYTGDRNMMSASWEMRGIGNDQE